MTDKDKKRCSQRYTLPCGRRYLLTIWVLALIIRVAVILLGCLETHWQGANKSSQHCYHTPCSSPPSFLHFPPPLFLLSEGPYRRLVCLLTCRSCASAASPADHWTPQSLLLRCGIASNCILVHLGWYSNCRPLEKGSIWLLLIWTNFYEFKPDATASNFFVCSTVSVVTLLTIWRQMFFIARVLSVHPALPCKKFSTFPVRALFFPPHCPKPSHIRW